MNPNIKQQDDKVALTEEEWRTIHHALSLYQVRNVYIDGVNIYRLPEVQRLMDKVYDNYIKPYDPRQNSTA